MGMSKRKIRNRKVIKALCTNFLKFNQVIVIKLNNVSNAQIQNARVAVQKAEKPGELIIGKNTIIQKALKWLTTEPEKGTPEFEDHSKWARRPELKSLAKCINGNVGLIFTDEDFSVIKEKIEAEVLQVDAKIGVIAPCNVFIPPGPTNIDVGKVAIFQKLGVPTKAVRNLLEIQKEIHIIVKNEKVGATGAELCRLLGLKPFSYKLEMDKIWMNGTVLEEDIINMPPSTIMDAFSAGVKQLTALSLGAGLPNALSVPHMISNGFKNTLAIGLSINYKFAALQKAQSAGPAQGNAPAQNNAQAKKAEVQAAPEPEPVEENVSMGGLFD